MNLEFISAQSIHLANQPPFNRPALYIIEPNSVGEKYKNCRRCGVAGSPFPSALWSDTLCDLPSFQRCRNYYFVHEQRSGVVRPFVSVIHPFLSSAPFYHSFNNADPEREVHVIRCYNVLA